MGRKPSDNRPLLHITSGDEPLAELQGAPIESTLFHSDIPYLAIHDIIDVGDFYYTGRVLKTSAGYNHYYEPRVPQKVWDYVNNKYLVAVSKVIYDGATVRAFPIGYAGQGRIERTGIFVGNFHGSAFANFRGRPSPYPTGTMANAWPPLNAHSIGGTSRDGDLGFKVESQYGRFYNLTGVTVNPLSNREAINNSIERSGGRYGGFSWDPLATDYKTLFFDNHIVRTPSPATPSVVPGWHPDTPNEYNIKFRFYVFNVKYNDQNHLEHVRPNIQDGIKISRDDMVIGNLSVKEGMLIADQAPVEKIDKLDSTNTTHKKYPFFNRVLTTLSMKEIAEYPFPLALVEKTSDGKWRTNWLGYSGYVVPLLQVYAPKLLVGDNATLQFSAEEIKYVGSKGEFLLASKNSKYTPLVLGGDKAITAIFPARQANFSQLRQGAVFRVQRINFASDWRRVLNPNECGSYYKEEIIQRIPLPPGSTSKNTLQVHISPITVAGVASSTIAGKVTSFYADCKGYGGWNILRPYVFTRKKPNEYITLGEIAYSTIRDVALSSTSGWWPFSSTGNRMQGVRLISRVRVNWARNELELYREYLLTNAALRVSEYSGRTTYYNKLGETEVTYQIPETRFDVYVMATG